MFFSLDFVVVVVVRSVLFLRRVWLLRPIAFSRSVQIASHAKRVLSIGSWQNVVQSVNLISVMTFPFSSSLFLFNSNVVVVPSTKLPSLDSMEYHGNPIHSFPVECVQIDRMDERNAINMTSPQRTIESVSFRSRLFFLGFVGTASHNRQYFFHPYPGRLLKLGIDEYFSANENALCVCASP